MSGLKRPWEARDLEEVETEMIEGLDHLLILTVEYIEEFRDSASNIELDYNIKMASRAMRCALQVYGQLLQLRIKQEEKGK